MTVCGGHLSADEAPTQLFSHAKFGDINYDNKEDCDWIIEAPHGKNVHLNFLTFELEDEQDCGYDFIEVREIVLELSMGFREVSQCSVEAPSTSSNWAFSLLKASEGSLLNICPTVMMFADHM